MQTTEPTRIYLAGPDIYHPDAAQRGQAMLELCASYGHRATFPLTQPFPKGNKRDRSIWIYSTNTRLIRNSDLIIANLNPYQGDQPDSGTVFEIGLAIGHRIPVIAYRKDTTPMHRNRSHQTGDSIEDYDLPVALMLGVPVRIIQGGLEDALKALNAITRTNREQAHRVR